MPTEYGAVKRSQPRGPAWSWVTALSASSSSRDALAVLEVDVAGFGEAEPARGAMEQLRAQPHLQFLHLAADGGLRQAQRARGGDEAAELDHLDEDEGVVEVARHRRLLRGDWPAVGTTIPPSPERRLIKSDSRSYSARRVPRVRRHAPQGVEREGAKCAHGMRGAADRRRHRCARAAVVPFVGEKIVRAPYGAPALPGLG